MAEEFGAMRAGLTHEQRMTVDPFVRMWLRLEARQGRRAAVPGLPPAPAS